MQTKNEIATIAKGSLLDCLKPAYLYILCSKTILKANHIGSITGFLNYTCCLLLSCGCSCQSWISLLSITFSLLLGENYLHSMWHFRKEGSLTNKSVFPVQLFCTTEVQESLQWDSPLSLSLSILSRKKK